MAKYTKAEVAESIDWLRTNLEPGDTVYAVIRSVAPSGMSRRMDLYKLTIQGPLYLSRHAACVLGLGFAAGKRGFRVNGCGMDMVAAVVRDVSRAVFGAADIPADMPEHARRDTGYLLRAECL